MMIRLSAFADEISPDVEEQIAVLHSEHIHFLDVRGVSGINVLDFTDEQARHIKHTLDTANIQVAALASPLGKVPVDTPLEVCMQRFERALELAGIFQTPYIRIFSFYPPAAAAAQGEDTDPAQWRDEVLRRLHTMTERARVAGAVLLHENEKGIYGDTIARNVDLFASIQNEHFQAVFDPANFIQCGQTPYPDAYEALRTWIRYVHVKDARPDGAVVAAGEGAAQWPVLLNRLHEDGYAGFFSLEPHLAAAGQFQGFSGPDLFHYASQTFQQLLHAMGWSYL